MKISARLLTIASFVKKDSFVADVGADHGLLEQYLLDNHLVQGVIAIENKTGPFKTLNKNLKNYENIEFSLSDGISEIDERVDTVVLAGMGGNLIVDILNKNIEKLKYVNSIVIDAHRDLELVRREIVKLGYKIEKEKIVYENKIYYFVISFIKGSVNYSDDIYEFGYKLKSDELFESYQKYIVQRLENNLKRLKSAKDPDCDKILQIESKIERLKNYEHC